MRCQFDPDLRGVAADDEIQGLGGEPGSDFPALGDGPEQPSLGNPDGRGPLLRREELATLTVETIQQREGRWVLAGNDAYQSFRKSAKSCILRTRAVNVDAAFSLTRGAGG